MDAMDNIKPEILKLLAAKKARRYKLAHLSISEKVKIVVQLQKIAAPVSREGGKVVHIWKIDDSASR